MLIYEKKVDDERHLFGTMGTIPSDADSQLSYVDDNDDPVVVSLSDSYFDDGHGGIKTSDGTSVNVILNDTVHFILVIGTSVILSIFPSYFNVLEPSSII